MAVVDDVVVAAVRAWCDDNINGTFEALGKLETHVSFLTLICWRHFSHGRQLGKSSFWPAISTIISILAALPGCSVKMT